MKSYGTYIGATINFYNEVDIERVVPMHFITIHMDGMQESASSISPINTVKVGMSLNINFQFQEEDYRFGRSKEVYICFLDQRIN